MAEQEYGGLSDREIEQLLSRLDELLGRLEQIPGATAAMALETVEALTAVYGEALARLVPRAAQAPDGFRALDADELLRHLMVLHGLHPDPVERRVDQALAEVRPYLNSHGGDVSLLGIEEGVARVALSGSCDGCASSSATLELAVSDAVLAAAPELAGVEPVAAPRAASPTVIPVEALSRRPTTTVAP